jgi:hypothetical protein
MCEAVSVAIWHLPQIGLSTEEHVLQGSFWWFLPPFPAKLIRRLLTCKTAPPTAPPPEFLPVRPHTHSTTLYTTTHISHNTECTPTSQSWQQSCWVQQLMYLPCFDHWSKAFLLANKLYLSYNFPFYKWVHETSRMVNKVKRRTSVATYF